MVRLGACPKLRLIESVAVHPKEEVTVTTYIPELVAGILEFESPVFQR